MVSCVKFFQLCIWCSISHRISCDYSRSLRIVVDHREVYGLAVAVLHSKSGLGRRFGVGFGAGVCVGCARGLLRILASRRPPLEHLMSRLTSSGLLQL